MLCRVMHTAETLRTGDHSVPRIEAQIYNTSETTRRADLYASIELTCPLEYTC